MSDPAGVNRKEQNLIFKRDAQLIIDKWTIKPHISMHLIMKWISNCYKVHSLLTDRSDGECRRVCCIARPINSHLMPFVTLSGKSKFQGKTHPLLWGLSLVKGRPRNVCAEFKCANLILQTYPTIEPDSLLAQYELCVFQLTTGEARKRCANCTIVTHLCKCSTDLS